MNPFNDLSPRPSTSARRFVPSAPLLLTICLVVSLAVVGWRTWVRSRTAHNYAQAEVQACAAALEFQLNQAAQAAETLGVQARQGKGGVTDFQRAAKELLTRYPCLSALQIEPGGLVTDVAPREGNERALGMAVLRDPVQGPDAGQARDNRVLAVSGPVRFSHGEQGIVARVPVFVRAADGRESFWGFVAASMQLQRALIATQVDQLSRRGYGFALYVPASARQKFNAIAYNGLSSLRDVEQQPVKVQKLELRLAVMPLAGWVNKVKLAFELAVALVMSALVWLLAYVLTGRRAVEADLAQATERLAQEQANRSKAEVAYKETMGQMGAAQAELKRAQLALEQANGRAAELDVRLEASARERENAVQLEQAKQKEAQAALAKAQETIAQLQTQLEAAAQAEKNTAATAEERLRQNQTALVELRAKLEAATRSAREAAKASAAERAQLEESNRELQARLAKAEQAEARVKELKGLLREAKEELKQRQAAVPESEEAAAAEAEGEAPQAAPEDAPQGRGDVSSPEEEGREEEAPAVTSSDVESPAPASEDTPSDASADAAAPSPEPVAEVAAESATETPVAVPEPVAPITAAEPPVSEPEVQSPAADAPASPAATEEAAAVAAEPSVPPKPASKPRRKKSRDDQMDLFGSEAPAAAKPPAKAAERAVEPKASPLAEKPAQRLPPAPPLDVAELRKAVHLILPLLVDQDPGAKDCLRDNRNTFRSAFTPEAYVDFEQLVKRGDFGAALEDLKKAARKHGMAGV